MNRSPFLVAVFAAGLAAVLTPDARALPILSFEESAVVVVGLPPGGRAAILGVGLGRDGFLPFEMAVWQQVEADGGGSARLDLGQPVPAYSAWAAVDLLAGEVGLAAPAGTPLREIGFPLRGLPARLDRLSDARSALYVLWVRPGLLGDRAAGAWAGGVRDGSGRDGDGAEDRRLEVLLDRLQPLGGDMAAAAPAALAAGDVLVGVDPETLEIYAVRLVH